MPAAPGSKANASNQNCQLQADGTGRNCGGHTANSFRSDHSGGCNFLFADGSVHFLNEDIDMMTYQNLSTMMGDDIVEIPTD